EIQEYTAAWRLEYVLQVKMSQYDAYTMYYENGSEDNSSLILLNDQGKPADPQPDPITSKIQANTTVIDRPETSEYEAREANWSRIVTDNTSSANPNGFTYEYRKVINAGEKLNPTDINNIRAIFTSANYAGSSYIQGEVYGGTNTSNTNITINGNIITSTADLSDRMNYEQFVENYLKGTDNKRQVTSSGLGQHLKIVDNNNDGVAEYVLQTIYTVAIINANGGLDIANVEFSHNNGRDDVNQVISTTPVVNDGEGELATGNVVIYALIDGNARAQLAATETVKINTVNRAATTATATGENGKTWTESDVHTHSSNMNSGVTGMVGNTTYTLYFDLYGNLAAYTEGDNGAFVLITDGWYRNALNGGEYAVRAYIDGSLKTVELTAGGNLFVNNSINGTWSSNNWGMLKTVAGLNCSNTSTTGHNDNVHTFVANLDGSVITPVDKMYNYIKTVRVLDVENNVVPGSGLANARIRDTNYQVGTAYVDGSTAAYNARVSALSNTIYYYVFNSTTGSNTNTVVRTFTGYGSTPTINANYIEDVYVVGTRANAATGYDYYTADVVVVELNADYDGSAHRTGEPVFVPDFSELTGNLGTENVRMIRSSTGEEATLLVNMGKSNLAWYDVTGENNNANNTVTRVAGLYYLSEDATNPGTYILDKMTAEQIRGESCILSGYVNRSTATQINNYATIDLMSVDKTQNAPEGEIVATNKRNVDNRAKLTENSKYYTLAYNSSRIADLKVSDAATVLAQVMRLNPNDNTPALLNEQVDGYSNTTNLNEVMMFVSGGNIVAAISFNEYRNFANVTRDYAQTVWANCLPSLNEDQGVKFYGVEDNKAGDLDADAKDITVSYADAAASFARGEDIVSVNGTNIQSWTLREVTDGVDNLKRLENTSADKRVDPATRKTGAHYILTVNYYVGGSDEYNLVMQAANTTAALVEKSPEDAPVLSGNTFDLSKSGKLDGQTVAVTDMTLPEFLSLFQLTGTNSRVVWQWTTKGNTSFTSEGLTISEDTIPGKVTMDDIKGVVATVYSEDGTIKSTYANTEGTLAASKQAALAAVEAKWNALSAEAKADAGVQAAYEALRNNIKGAANATDLQAYYNNGALTDTAVDSVDSAVEMVGKGTELPEADENGKIILTQDVVLSTMKTIGADTSIDLNGHEIAVAAGQKAVIKVDAGKLTLTDSVGTGKLTASTGVRVVAATGGDIDMTNVNIESDGASALYVQSSTSKVVVTGGTLTTTGYPAVFVHGNTTGDSTGSITFNGTTINSDMGPAIALNGKATVNVVGDNTKITGPVGIEVRNGSLNVSGGVITSNDPVPNVVASNNGPTARGGAGIVVSPYDNAGVDIKVSVTGGTVSGTNGIWLVDLMGSANRVANVRVNTDATVKAESPWTVDKSNGEYTLTVSVNDGSAEE
ncbi:MAG: hypothetical protein HFF66_11980, partial [Oscillospiraceae bacterium]|nr:hypothetical protein [Oscillospiraceae bacterium]